METYWVIKSFYKSNEQYFSKTTIEKDMFSSPRIWSDNIWSSTKFETEQEAVDMLEVGRFKYQWGGIYQIEKIYISR